MNKEKFTRAGFEPVTSGLTCRRSTNRANLPYIGGLPILSMSLFGGRQSEVMKPYTALQPGIKPKLWYNMGRGSKGIRLFYKYHVINHKGNWLGTLLDKFRMNKEKITRAALNLRPLPTELTGPIYNFQCCTKGNCCKDIFSMQLMNIYQWHWHDTDISGVNMEGCAPPHPRTVPQGTPSPSVFGSQRKT